MLEGGYSLDVLCDAAEQVMIMIMIVIMIMIMIMKKLMIMIMSRNAGEITTKYGPTWLGRKSFGF